MTVITVVVIALAGWYVGGLLSRALLSDSFEANAERWDGLAARWRAIGCEDEALRAERRAAADRNYKWWGIV